MCWATNVQCPVTIPPLPRGTTGTKDPRFSHGILQSAAEILRSVVKVPLKPFTGLVGCLVKIISSVEREFGGL